MFESCVVLEKGNKVALLTFLPGGNYRAVSEEMERRCREIIADYGYAVKKGNKERATFSEAKQYYEQQGYHFHGEYVEMDMPLSMYDFASMPVSADENIQFTYYKGEIERLREAVAAVDHEWVQYFAEDSDVFCGFVDGEIASFCIIGDDEDCLVSEAGIRVGSIGCVGTVPSYRKRGIGLYMVALATRLLKESGCDKAFIHYTHLVEWYGRLGYQKFMKFSFGEKNPD